MEIKMLQCSSCRILFILSFAISWSEGRIPISLQNVTNAILSTGLNNISSEQFIKRSGEFSQRILWPNKKTGKLLFPLNTILALTPMITLPAFRQSAMKGALNADMQISLPIYMALDKMGYTSDMLPFPFDRPPFYPFGPIVRPIEPKGGFPKKDEKDKMPKPKDPNHMTKEEHDALMDFMEKEKYGEMEPEEKEKANQLLRGQQIYPYHPVHKRVGAGNERKGPARRRVPRSVMSLPPPERFPGGERAVLLPRIETMLSSIGFEGRGCMLRAMCEIHQFPMKEGYGLMGDLITTVFSVSESYFAESHMPEYLKAELAGKAGNCERYKDDCSKSIFKWENRKREDDLADNQVSQFLRSKLVGDEL